MVSVCTSSPGLVICGRWGLSLRTRFFRPRAIPDHQRIRLTLLSEIAALRTVTRWCHTTSAQRLSCERTVSTSCTSSLLTAHGLVCGLEVVVGIFQQQRTRWFFRLYALLGRLGLSICVCLFSASHLRFQRHTVLRWIPHFRATISSGNWSSTSNRIAVALALGR